MKTLQKDSGANSEVDLKVRTSENKEFNLLAQELFFFLILTHPVYKM